MAEIVNAKEVVAKVIHACGEWEEDTLINFDWEGLETIHKMIGSHLKIHSEQVKETAKKEKAELAIGGKAYYNSLKVGAEFSYKSADGVVHRAKKIETKSGSGLRAACELLEYETKSARRYPTFNQVIVPVQSVQAA